jgi:NADH-quinone oxidoreductase subunit L
MIFIASIGIITALYAAVVALFQDDIKKVLAYSTISQLGLMFLGLGSGAFAASMFHLMTHAFFKALLFLAAGSIIHSLGGEQDLRNMGGLKKSMPYTYVVFLVASLSISGIPPFAGFFSKDDILGSLFYWDPLVWILGLLVSVFTAFYTFRIFYLAFSGTYRGKKPEFRKIHESPKLMIIPLLILGFLALTGGLIGLPEGIGINRIANFLDPVFKSSSALMISTGDHESSVNLALIATTLAVVGLSIFSAWYLFIHYKKVPPGELEGRKGIEKIVQDKFYTDEIYRAIITEPILKLSSFFHDTIDLKIIDRFVELIGSLILWAGDKIRYLQTGNVGFYLFAMAVGILAILFFNIYL